MSEDDLCRFIQASICTFVQIIAKPAIQGVENRWFHCSLICVLLKFEPYMIKIWSNYYLGNTTVQEKHLECVCGQDNRECSRSCSRLTSSNLQGDPLCKCQPKQYKRLLHIEHPLPVYKIESFCTEFIKCIKCPPVVKVPLIHVNKLISPICKMMWREREKIVA